ncbi:hypothetical protein ACFC08_29635 [Streptomyces sp. NPDC056112]|uniref:hypothetical protein n=1 Tax=Streptomyces sp. NPDC056112 TaxID=3345715 RepID=UPI0035DAB71F
MPDAAALSALIGAGLPATYTFLYQRLANVLDRRGTPEPEPDLPPTLQGNLQMPLVADAQQLARRQTELMQLRDALNPYQRGAVPIDSTDEPLLRTLGRLRSLLEEVYGQRLTFTGEQRPASGPYVRQKTDTVRGELTGMEAEIITGEAEVVQDTNTVEAGGKVTGMQADQIGLTRRKRPRR